MYKTVHYVKINSRVYIPGEILPDIDKETAEWLLFVGAIQFFNAKKSEPVTEEDDFADINIMEGIVKEEPKPEKKSTGRKKK